MAALNRIVGTDAFRDALANHRIPASGTLPKARPGDLIVTRNGVTARFVRRRWPPVMNELVVTFKAAYAGACRDR
jgi:hypothetical protein